ELPQGAGGMVLRLDVSYHFHVAHRVTPSSSARATPAPTAARWPSPDSRSRPRPSASPRPPAGARTSPRMRAVWPAGAGRNPTAAPADPELLRCRAAGLLRHLHLLGRQKSFALLLLRLVHLQVRRGGELPERRGGLFPPRVDRAIGEGELLVLLALLHTDERGLGQLVRGLQVVACRPLVSLLLLIQLEHLHLKLGDLLAHVIGHVERVRHLSCHRVLPPVSVCGITERGARCTCSRASSRRTRCGRRS